MAFNVFYGKDIKHDFRSKLDFFYLVLPNIFRLPVGVRQLNISLEQCRNIALPVPPTEMQQHFVENAEMIRSIQSQQSTATAKAQATFDALLADAFKAA